MVQKYKLHENLEILTNNMTSIQNTLMQLMASQRRSFDDSAYIIMVVESVFKVLERKGIITRSEYESTLKDIIKSSNDERDLMFLKAHENARESYLSWLLTVSNDYGNA